MLGNDEKIIILYDVVEHFIVVSSLALCLSNLIIFPFLNMNQIVVLALMLRSLPSFTKLYAKKEKKEKFSVHDFISVSLMMLI